MVRDRIKALKRMRAGDLQPDPRNWRRHPESQKKALQAILEEIGYADALIARETDEGIMLIDGHLRADLDDNQEVPVLILDVNEEEAGKILATLDPLAGLAEIDETALRELATSIDFQHPDLDELLDGLLPDTPVDIEEDDVPEVDEGLAITQMGDVWLCGRHRVICGDATDSGVVSKLLAGVKPLLMVTDPPYGVNYDPKWRNEAAEAGHLAYAARRIGRVVNDDRVDWSDAYRLFPGDVAYTWSPSGEHVILTGQSIQAAGFEIRNQIIWSKPHFPISRGHYTYQHEPCWYAVRKGAKSYWCGDHNASTVWQISLDKNVEGGHSTQKPVECMARPIRNHDAPVVYDPFLGSGTTMSAAEQLDRTCYGIEIEPKYVDVVCKRYMALTGESPTRESDGAKFGDLL